MRKTMKLSGIIIGAGQAGLAVSYFLKKQGIEHLILEKEKTANSWRNQRWDSFKLITPNWQNRLPGYPYQDDLPEEFLTKDKVIQYLIHYQKKFQLPVLSDSEVVQISQTSSNLFEVVTSDQLYLVKFVVIATGSFFHPFVPQSSTTVPKEIVQLTSSEYRNPQSIPDGPVLVVGSGQSGFQIANELHSSGKQVFLSVDKITWLPRTYRGKDISYWLTRLGVTELPIEKLSNPLSSQFVTSPIITDKKGGIRKLSRDGIQLLGRFKVCSENKLYFGNNLQDSLVKSDLFFIQVIRLIDQFIQKNQMRVPGKINIKAELALDTQVPSLPEIDLTKTPISTIIWATGFKSDFSWVHLPVFDSNGFPKFQRGVTEVSGVYFLGLHGLHNLKSASLFGVGEDAEFIFEKIKLYLKSNEGQPPHEQSKKYALHQDTVDLLQR